MRAQAKNGKMDAKTARQLVLRKTLVKQSL
jgi:hypothetical protein